MASGRYPASISSLLFYRAQERGPKSCIGRGRSFFPNAQRHGNSLNSQIDLSIPLFWVLVARLENPPKTPKNPQKWPFLALFSSKIPTKTQNNRLERSICEMRLNPCLCAFGKKDLPRPIQDFGGVSYAL